MMLITLLIVIVRTAIELFRVSFGGKEGVRAESCLINYKFEIKNARFDFV